jgi:hypothetical protein
MSFWSCRNLAGILRQETSRSAGSGAVWELEFDVEELLAEDVCAGSDPDEVSVAGAAELSCARAAIGENANHKPKAGTAKKRGITTEQAVNEQFPLNRADGAGRTASGISVS